jgi:signal transduction histidine kinase
VILEVMDNGRGMEPGLLNHFRETGAGTGVGLMSMHERARELGGKFQIESDASGASMRVTIPVPSDCATNVA